jgi:hypothetical protein
MCEIDHPMFSLVFEYYTIYIIYNTFMFNCVLVRLITLVPTLKFNKIKLCILLCININPIYLNVKPVLQKLTKNIFIIHSHVYIILY